MDLPSKLSEFSDHVASCNEDEIVLMLPLKEKLKLECMGIPWISEEVKGRWFKPFWKYVLSPKAAGP